MSKAVLAAAALAMVAVPYAAADSEPHSLAGGPFRQDWSRTDLITANDDWTGVRSIVGYRGDALAASTGICPATIVASGTNTPVDVSVNLLPGSTTGGIAEFDGLPDPVVALQGSGTARAPFLLLHMCSAGMMQVRVRYDLRDVDGTADNSVQQVALQYRTCATGDFVNVPAGYVADATTGPSVATNVTRVDVVLPEDADDRAELQIRIITADATGSDEWVGVDNIVVEASPLTVASLPLASGDGGCSVSCPTRAGWNYMLQRSTDLMDWTDVGPAFAGDGNPHAFADCPAGGPVFWRVAVWESGPVEVRGIAKRRR